MKRHYHFRKLIVGIIIFILIIPISTSVNHENNGNMRMNDDSSISESNWLTGWENRKSHQILGATGAGVNYQVEITVNYGSGLDSENNVYCDFKCQPDFDDIRFTDSDGITLLDYWTETVYDSDNATFWVEVTDNLDFNVTIYMYYGNSTVASLSDGFETFIFFDDFDSTPLGADLDPSRWWLEEANDPNDYVRIALDPVDSSNQVAEAAETGDDIANVAWANDWGPIGNMAIGHKFRYDLDYKGYYATKDESHTFVFIEQLEYTGTNNHQWYDVDSDYFDYNPSLTTVTDEWYSWEYRFFGDQMTLLDRDNNILSSGGYVFSTLNETRTTCTRYGLRHGSNTWWTDDMYVRKFVPSEPIHGIWEGPYQISWQHDCSDPTDFVYNDTWNMTWMDWTITTGTLTSDGSTLSVTSVPTGSNYHGPVFEHELPYSLKVRDINNFSALFDVDNSLASYLGYQVVMLGDANRNPVLFFSFGDGWSDFQQGAYGISYVFEDGSRVGYGSGYPITWTSFNGLMSINYTEGGLLGYVEGIGQESISGLSEADFDREIKYIAIASARFGSDPMFPVLVDELILNYEFYSAPDSPPASINHVEDFQYELGTSGNVIEWIIADFTPTAYELWKDGELAFSEVWPGDSLIEVDIDNLTIGVYNYSIVVYGEEDVVVSDSVIVTVVDTTAPILNHPTDIIGDIVLGSIQITWQPTDLLPFNYEIYENGTIVSSGTWTSGENLTYTIDELTITSYNITIVVWDTSGNYARDTVIVTIDQGHVQPIGDFVIIGITAGSLVVIVVVIGLICRNKGGPQSGSLESGYNW